MSSGEILQILRDIESDGRKNAAPAPAIREERAQWQGLAFQLGGVGFVSVLGEVEEVLQLPRLTALPRVKEWVLGIANIRGRLIPIFDLQRLMQLGSYVPRVNWRVLIVSDEDLTAGLYVEQSLGIQQFPYEVAERAEPERMTLLQPYIEGAYRKGEQRFYLVNLRALIKDERFMDVAE